jgi:hypothetical protein
MLPLVVVLLEEGLGVEYLALSKHCDLSLAKRMKIIFIIINYWDLL